MAHSKNMRKNRNQIILILILLFTGIYSPRLLGQEIKKKTISNQGVKETFYQKKIKGKGKIKEGKYKKYLKSYYQPSILFESGQYSDDVKSGIWTHYNTEGDSIYAYNHDLDSVVYINTNAKRVSKEYMKFYTNGSKNKFASSYFYSVNYEFDKTENFSLPIYFEGDSDFHDILFASVLSAINYNGGNSGSFSNFKARFASVIVLKINKNGILEEVQISELDKVHLKDLENLLLEKELKFIPAYQDGIPINYGWAIPIFCVAKEDGNGYNFTLRFCKRDSYGDQIPYYDEWPFGLSSNTQLWTKVK
jgi:hypothetical protein